MDPVAGGRQRGFRAPAADPPGPTQRPAPVPPDPSSGDAELLETGPARRSSRLPRPLARPRQLGAAAAVLVAVLLVAVLAFRVGSGTRPAADQAPTPAPTPAATPTPLPVPDLYARVAGSIVLVTTSKGSLGSGVIVTDTGAVLTANHVVSGGGRITLTFADGTRSGATVASASPKTDTATLQPQKLPEVVVPATLGGGVAIGADVVAVGNPLGLRASTTAGVVSGLDRQTKTTTAGTLTGLIQFDAAVNPGSSGGPLFDAFGTVVGVVVSIADPGRDDAFAGIAFAVPIGAALGGSDGDGPGGGPRL